ncbi:hypothetical protein N7493_009592 [Penicillium malachiteum]|uniref:Phenylalanine ammonia-lyase n=1 Tax=Penicillium malachiteum TaxID=1324776 RepID=A0AAD6MSC1_9EURO|nr:hypothetical protein N7493_009592 [Penicillium malachiteum]
MSHSSEHFQTAKSLWKRAQGLKGSSNVTITGKDLDIATVFAVSQGGCQPFLTEDEPTCARIHESVKQLSHYLEKGRTVYGVTTGFGGSADSRTKEVHKLQISLLQLTQSGVILASDQVVNDGVSEHRSELTSMPMSWVRAAMLVRCNATARGHSAVTMNVLQAILRLLRHDIVPMVPLKGSVSASGDLMPLAFIAGAIEGNPDIKVCQRQGESLKILSAEAALAQHQIPKMNFGPKEALGLVNGTASSAGLASIVMYEVNHVATLSQAFTAMAVEAMLGNSESFHPFISEARPHPGQIEVSRNILAMLQGSYLAKGIRNSKDYAPEGLFQDRYSLRSTPQWIGPQLEDLLSANSQITVELNSSADNPIVDADAQEVYYGANFQAAAVTSAMEKTRLALQMLGKLFFAQSTELIDANLNNGLPANLCADNPSLSFTMKGVDINMAAYMSELGFLANPVSNHVQSAEMGNQSINSLALLSSRMTKKAVELVSLMGATCLYVGCQALDLRVMQIEYLDELYSTLQNDMGPFFASSLELKGIESYKVQLRKQLTSCWRASSRLDDAERFNAVADGAALSLLHVLKDSNHVLSESGALSSLQPWRSNVESKAASIYKATFRRFCAKQTTEQYLGVSSQALYRMIRKELAVPFHQGLGEHPGSEDTVIYGENVRPRKIIGNWIATIYESILDGRMNHALYGVPLDVGNGVHASNGNGVHSSKTKQRK